MAAALDEGLRERGEVISTLFPTAPGIYRRYGFELVTTYDTVEIATSRLMAIQAAGVDDDPARDGRRLRRRTPCVRDLGLGAERAADTRQARRSRPTRTSSSTSFTGVTLALAGDDVVGYASWNRGSGYGDTVDARGRRPGRPDR